MPMKGWYLQGTTLICRFSLMWCCISLSTEFLVNRVARYWRMSLVIVASEKGRRERKSKQWDSTDRHTVCSYSMEKLNALQWWCTSCEPMWRQQHSIPWFLVRAQITTQVVLTRHFILYKTQFSPCQNQCTVFGNNVDISPLLHGNII